MWGSNPQPAETKARAHSAHVLEITYRELSGMNFNQGRWFTGRLRPARVIEASVQCGQIESSLIAVSAVAWHNQREVFT